MRAHRLYRAGAMLTLLGALSGASGMYAQGSNSPYSYLFKLRAGLTAGDMQKTHFDNKIMGLAAEVKRGMPGIGGALFGELSWEYAPGRHHDIYPWGSDPTVPSGPMNLLPRYSFDNRKEYGQGINLRLGYAAPMPDLGPQAISNAIQKMEWFAGIGIDRFKVRSEVRYFFNFNNVAIITTTPAGIYDGGNFVMEESKLAPGFFAGLRYKLPSEIGFELSLRNFGMWHMDYVPSSYESKGLPPEEKRGTGTTSTGTSRGWALEFAITAKL